jgi:hypothetical protein
MRASSPTRCSARWRRPRRRAGGRAGGRWSWVGRQPGVWQLPLVEDDEPAAGLRSTSSREVAATEPACPLRRPDRRVLRGRRLRPVPGEPVRLDAGLFMTTPQRTLRDLVGRTSDAAVVRALDDASAGLVDPDGLTGPVRFLRLVRLADGRAESPAETRADLRSVLPGIVPQVRPSDASSVVVARFDLADEGCGWRPTATARPCGSARGGQGPATRRRARAPELDDGAGHLVRPAPPPAATRERMLAAAEQLARGRRLAWVGDQRPTRRRVGRSDPVRGRLQPQGVPGGRRAGRSTARGRGQEAARVPSPRGGSRPSGRPGRR